MQASVAVVKNTGVSFGSFVFSLVTLLMINAIILIPTALILREFLEAFV